MTVDHNDGAAPTGANELYGPQGYGHTRGASRLFAEVVSRPRWPVYIATTIAVLLAWYWLAVLSSGVAQVSPGAGAAPGMDWLGSILAHWGLAADNQVVAYFVRLCSPQGVGTVTPSVFFAIAGMWTAMSVAMMLPSAAPLLRTYADIADVAASKKEPVVSIGYLVAGYIAMWMAFALIASALQLFLMQLNAEADTSVEVGGLLAGLILCTAGAYQLSALKHACLEKCRNPFSVLFGQWRTEPYGVFKLGLEQGLFCIGCCWALMLVMLVVGTMNLAWMAFFTLFTILEKSGRGKVTSHVSGAILLAWGGLVILLAMV